MPEPKKTVEELLEEQNALLREQNKILARPRSTETDQQRFARMADTWDKQQGWWGRLSWKNPYRN